MMKIERVQIKSLQAVRAIAALLVVVGHTGAFVSIVPGLWQRANLIQWFREMGLGVEAFFVLSGFVIYTAHRWEIGKSSAFRGYLWKRFRRIYPLYWIALLLTLPARLLHLGADKTAMNSWILVSNILLFHVGSTETIVSVAWTLFHEILFYSFFAALLVSKKFGPVVLGLWLLGSLFFFDKNMSTTSLGYWHIMFSPLHLLFALGMLMAWTLEKREIRWPRALLFMGVTFFLIAAGLNGPLNSDSTQTHLLAGVGAMLGMLGAARLELQGRLVVPRWLSFLGDASYSIYLFHPLAIGLLSRIEFRVDATHHIPLPIWMVATVSLSVLAGCILHVWLELPLLRWLGARGSSKNLGATGLDRGLANG